MVLLAFTNTSIGVSYVTTDKSSIEDINIVSSWPGDPSSSFKTPTRIAYARENAKISSNKWGFEVDPKLISYSWTKLLLDKNATLGEHDDPALFKMAGTGMLQLPPFRQAADVCEDYLHEVYRYVSAKLREQMTDLTFETTPWSVGSPCQPYGPTRQRTQPSLLRRMLGLGAVQGMRYLPLQSRRQQPLPH